MEVKAKPDFGHMTGGCLMHAREPDFSGWATKVDLLCTDGRTILRGAFKHQDKAQVPLVWQHNHDSPENILGHAILEDREEGTYAYGFFNDSPQATSAKTAVEHRDISFLSIFANGLKEKAKQVSHGVIRELSLVMAGANPGALIDNIAIRHGDGIITEIEDEAIIYTGIPFQEEEEAEEVVEHAEDDTLQEVYDGMTDEQKNLVQHMVGAAIESTKQELKVEHSATTPPNSGEETRRMSRNVFEEQNKKTEPEQQTLSHDDMRGIAADAVRRGSFKEAVEDYALKHGIEDINILFPDAKTITATPEWDKRRTEWVAGVLNGVRKLPFARVKSVIADITQPEARARGYIKGNLKKEEWFGLTKRTTTPTTVYKKQQLDRDDIVDITDFDVVVWLKGEMRLMLDEEIARAILIGDGREVDDEDKVKDPAAATDGAGIRSILNDHELYAARVYVNIDDASSSSQEIVDEIIKQTHLYKGSGTPTFYTTIAVRTSLLLARDTTGRRLYRSVDELANELGVSSIVTVEVMEDEPDLVGIIVNLTDYAVGTDRGGEVSWFDDFDIDYNQYKYLGETRLSGGLTKIRSALIIQKTSGTNVLVAPASPAFDSETGEIDITDQTGVVYKRADTNAVVNTAGSPYTIATPGDSLKIYAQPASGYYFETDQDDEWTFTRDPA